MHVAAADGHVELQPVADDLVQRLNHHSQEPWVILKKGGPHGGGAEITPHALKAMQEYEKLQQKIDELLEQQEALIRVFK